MVTGSYLNQNGDDVVSGSVLRTLDGTDVISGSAQITFGFVSESGDLTHLNTFTSSADSRLDNLEG